MPNDLTPGDFDYDGFSDAIKDLASKAVSDGADPQYVASRTYAASMSVAMSHGLTSTLKHILLVQDQAEADMRRFYDTYNHRFDLREVLKGNLVEKK